MSPREALVSETRQSLERAQADSHDCAVLIGAGLAAEALFHAQQCAEKAIKALLTWHQIPFRKTHDSDELRQVCLPLAGSAAIHLTGIERLSHYAWRFRYPGATHTPEPLEAEAAGHAAGELLKAVADLLELQFHNSDVAASEAGSE